MKQFIKDMKKDFKKYWMAYLLVLPTILYFILFHYKPMYGVVIAFQNYRPTRGILGSEWVGLEHFEAFIDSYYFERLIKNTLRISISGLLFGFPAPIILALLLNEIKNEKFKRITQTISYLPHFISTVVICSMIKMFVSADGFITEFFQLFGFPNVSMLSVPELFTPIYTISGIWAGMGWGAIIYLSALSGIDQNLYEAAKIDGANRWKQTIHVTLPGIAPTIIIMLLLRIGNLLDVGRDKVMLLYNEGIYETADVINTYVYRAGLEGAQWSYSSAIGLFNNVINFVLVIVFNKISKKVTEVSLW